MTASGVSPYAQHLIDALDLAPHPEGGWYRRTWQSPIAAPTGMPADAAPATTSNVAGAADLSENSTSARPLASLIYFLLPAGDSSDWHVVDADELWLWHGPGAVTMTPPSLGPRRCAWTRTAPSRSSWSPPACGSAPSPRARTPSCHAS